MARANIHSLERAVLIRRLYINERDGEGRTPSEELAGAPRCGRGRRARMAAARGFIEKALDWQFKPARSRRAVRLEHPARGGAREASSRCRPRRRS